MPTTLKMKEVSRVVNGLALVVKEAVRHEVDSRREGGFVFLIKKALLSAADLSGLTKGKVREFSVANARSKQSVVYFNKTPTSPIVSHEDQAFPSSIERDQMVVSDSTMATTDTAANVQIVGESNGSHAQEGFLVKECDPDSQQNFNVTEALDSTAEATTSTSSHSLTSKRQRKPRERRVPSTPFSRALGFAGLGAGLAWGTIQESAKKLVFGEPNLHDNQSSHSVLLSEKNAERLALALCRMRGAALKLGQMLSIQDESLVPAPILAALDVVRQGADVMPRSQLNKVLDTELGPDWSSKLTSFDYEPIAAASIGQVHQAVTKDGLLVAMKIQYPGVADSIESDIKNVKLLLDYTNLIPEKLYLDRAMQVAKEELSRECDYQLEAANQKRFRNLLFDTKGVYVPLVVDDISSKRVLTTELVPGLPIDKVASLDKENRNFVGKKLLELTLKELFVFRFMQTDPNWSNFLYDETAKSINLIDFGAARDYPKHFVDNYLKMVLACASCDREAVIEMSRRLGFLTGMESEVMLEAHVQAAFVVGLPFAKPGGFDFRSTNIIQSMSNLGATMLRHRLTPPPDEAYSLHRKLSGTFLACIKLGVVVSCRDLLLEVYETYQFDEDKNEVISAG